MKNSKLFPVIVLLLAAAIALTTGIMIRDSGRRNAPAEISVIVENSSDNRWNQFLAGMQQAAEDHNAKLTIVPTGRMDNLADEKSLIEGALSDGADGLIVQLCTDKGAEEMFMGIGSVKPIELVETETNADMTGVTGSVSPDQLEIGKALAKEIAGLSEKPLSECVIAVVLGNPTLSSMQQRLQGFTDVLAQNGGEIAWKLEQTAGAASLRERFVGLREPDILVALDNASMEAAGEYAASLSGEVLLVGAGTSVKAIYYLDSGIAQSLVVPEEYMMGYHSVRDLAEHIYLQTSTVNIQSVPFRIVRKDTLFTEENQELLFPIQ